MNKNKLSRFLLSTSVGIITALGISEVSANLGESTAQNTTIGQQSAEIEVHRAAATDYYQKQNPGMAASKIASMADSLVLNISGLSALNRLGDQTQQLFAHFSEILSGGIDLTADHFDIFLTKIADSSTLRALGLDSVRDLNSSEAERLVAPAQITTVADATYFAEQRKNAGEFEAAAEFFLQARKLTGSTNTTKLTEYAESALLMYSEHFIHHVARVSSVTEDNVKAAQALLAQVKALAESTDTAKAFMRAASCAEELGTAIYDLALKQIAARDKLTDATAITAEDVKIAKVYVSLYNADIVARDMHEKAAGKYSGQAKNSEFVAAAESMRLAIGALADAQGRSSTAVFEADVSVSTKLYDETIAFENMYTELSTGILVSEAIKTSAATSQIALSKLKATWNARSKFVAGSDQRKNLDTQYDALGTFITEVLVAADNQYSNINTSEQYLSAREIAVVRSVRAEMLYRLVLDAAAVDSIVEADVTTAVDNLRNYVTTNTSSVRDVVTGMDTALKGTLDEAKAAGIRSARTACNRTLAGSYALIAKAAAKQLEKISTAALGGTLVKRAEWLDNYLKYARLANNKAAWEAGVTAIDVVLAVVDVAGAANDARLVKALALTAKAEALLKRNTVADDTLVATVNATTGALATGLLFDAEAVATAMAAGASHVTAHDHLRKAFESAVELHNSAAVVQGLRTVWASVEDAYAVGKLTLTDADLTLAVGGNATFAGKILSTLSAASTVDGAKALLAFDTAAVAVTTSAVGTGANDTLNMTDYIEVTVAGKRYVSKANATNITAVSTTVDFEAVAAGAPVGGATEFSLTATPGAATITALVTALNTALSAGAYRTSGTFAGQADTLAAHYRAMAAAPTTIITGETVKLDDLDTVEGLYNHLMAKFASIREASDIYKGYVAAAAAFEKARMAKADWAAAEVAGLSAEAAATWMAKRNAAGDAYTDAADYEIKRLRALFAAAGHGKYDVTDTVFAKLTDIIALAPDLATVYVTEDVLDSLHRRAMSLKEAATTYNTDRAAVGTDAAIDANKISRNAAVHKSVRIDAVHIKVSPVTEAKPILNTDTTAEAGNGAYEVALTLVNAAYQGLAGFNTAADLGTFVGERLSAITNAYRKVNAAWLSDLTATITLAKTATDAQDHRDALVGVLVNAPASAVVSGDANTAGYIYDLGELLDDSITGGNYVATQSFRRGIALGYETVLKTLAVLATTTVKLEDEQGVVYDALKDNAELAKPISLTAYVAATPSTTNQMNDVITQLTERADLAEAVVAAAYGALRSNTPSDTTKSGKAARAQAITAMTGLIQEGAMDFADIVLKEESNVATADLKAKASHQLGRLLMTKAAAERIRFDNLGAAADKANALTWYLEAVKAFNKEIAAILSQLDAASMANRNTRLAAAYENLAEAYKHAIANGADAALVKEQYTAVFNQAQILYREGSLDRSAAMLEELTNTTGAVVVKGTIIKELAEQYEAVGKFVKAAKAYKSSTQNHVAQDDAAAAFEAAENALKAAQQSGHTEACIAAADSFNLIGAKVEFHGRVRAEAYQKAAEAYILGELNEEASVAYNASGSAWAKIGDHMQAGNQHEKAAWALSKVASVTVDQRIEIIQAVEKAAHQLQIADATKRLEKLVDLAEEQIKAIQDGADSLTTGKLKTAVVAAAGAMYEKALAFQKEGDLSHAEASQARIEALVKIVDSNGKEAGIHLNVAKLYSLQKKDSLAADTYIKAAESFVEGVKLLDAANAYAAAADALLAAGFGVSIKEKTLAPLLEISKSVRAGGSNAGRDDQFEVHLAVVEVYLDLAKITPSELDNALAEVEAIIKEAPADKAMQARIAGVKIGLLSQKVGTSASDAAKIALVQQAQAAFDGIKSLNGETMAATVSVKRYVAMAGNALAKTYELSRIIHTENGLVYLNSLRSVVEVAEAAAKAAYDAAASLKTSYDVALEAAKEAARSMESYTKGMIHYIASEKDKARTEDMVYLRGIPDRMTKVVENAVRETLLGILKSREEAAVIQSNFVEVLDAANKISTYVSGLRNSDAAHDSHGDATKTAELKTTMATTSTAITGVSGDLKDQAAAAHVLAPVARAAETDKLVAAKADAVASAVSTSMQAQSTLVTTAPASNVNGAELANHAQAMVETVVGNNGIAKSLQAAQTGGPTSPANAVIKRA